MQINLENITLRAGERAIFAHTSWVIPPGQHWAIFGPTGAGKTTLASAISRGSGLLSGQIQYSIPGEASRPYVYPHEIVTFSAETTAPSCSASPNITRRAGRVLKVKTHPA